MEDATGRKAPSNPARQGRRRSERFHGIAALAAHDHRSNPSPLRLGFPESSRDRVKEEEIRAAREFNQRSNTARSEREVLALLVGTAMRPVNAFCQEAVQLDWGASRIDKEFHNLVLSAQIWVGLVDGNGQVRSEVQRQFEQSGDWKQCQDIYVAPTGAQVCAATEASQLPAAAPNDAAAGVPAPQPLPLSEMKTNGAPAEPAPAPLRRAELPHVALDEAAGNTGGQQEALSATKQRADLPPALTGTHTRVPMHAELKEAESRTADPKLRNKLVAVLRYSRYFEDLKVLKTACQRYQTPALLEQNFRDLDVWVAMNDDDKADIAKGNFLPGVFAWSLVRRMINLTGHHNRTLKNYRKALRAAGLL
jgi:hypothetical protein